MDSSPATEGDTAAPFGPDVVLDAAARRALVALPHRIAAPSAAYRVEGTGALQCIQGIFTNDVMKCAPDALVWGAVLTPKGMIIFDMWVRREGDAALMIVPAAMREVATTLFRRTFPPRIARVTEVTDQLDVHWLVGDGLLQATPDVAIPAGPAPFAALALASGPIDARWPVAPVEWTHASRLVNGWPAIGHEIDERTLPQEVRFDELDGVRYDKGCYTGQETVARLHFRGHANRTLRGLRWLGGTPVHRDVVHDGRKVGTVTTCGIIGGEWRGLAKLRREVETGATVLAGGEPAHVIDLPMHLP